MQLEEELQTHLRWSMGVKSILYAGKSKFQAYELVDSYTFGKVWHSCSDYMSETQVSLSLAGTGVPGQQVRENALLLIPYCACSC